ncbi:RNA polymerase sigma-70 factor [Chitinophaga barathri]|uniref:RNA polymerase sigma-70 factor n=1 Tax=Chitinophaga barathri TaxID=1647451 RepID=A0A3N4MK29_9BACT|nr:RNA polymerase sigma-70 factor [Chitinophaga barathri]RPD39929.1 RNA polymerase sigma-70 factor [Chitinophaga barathri]
MADIENHTPGEEQEFRQLFDIYFEKVHYLSMRYIRNGSLSEEVAMDIMFRIWKNRQRISEIENRDGYIFKLAYNTIINTLRKKEHLLFSIDSFEENNQPVADRSPLYTLYSKELHAAYENAILALPEKRRQIYIMNREQNLSSSEIARILGISPRTVEHQIGSALRTIREAMKQYGVLMLPFII